MYPFSFGYTPRMIEDIQRILLDRGTIEARVQEMAGQIAADYAAAGHSEFLLMPLLTGSIIFVADLMATCPSACAWTC